MSFNINVICTLKASLLILITERIFLFIVATSKYQIITEYNARTLTDCSSSECNYVFARVIHILFSQFTDDHNT